ncbi:CsbD family protein [Streptomyces sp. NPDC016562]
MSKAHVDQVEAETAGRTTGDERMPAEGRTDQAQGSTGYAKEDVEDVLRR